MHRISPCLSQKRISIRKGVEPSTSIKKLFVTSTTQTTRIKNTSAKEFIYSFTTTSNHVKERTFIKRCAPPQATIATTTSIFNDNDDDNDDALSTPTKTIDVSIITIVMVYVVACIATCMNAVARVSFSVLAVPIQEEWNLSMSDMGFLQSTMLIGYVLGMIPAGILSDRWGGPQTLVAGLVGWSMALCLLVFTKYVHWPLTLIAVSRLILGVFQSTMMPAVSATSALYFPPTERASKTSSIYAWYSAGCVLGMVITPLMVSSTSHSWGWQGAVLVFGIVGILAGVACFIAISSPPFRSQQKKHDVAKYTDSTPQNISTPKPKFEIHLSKFLNFDVLLLCWTHSVIGFSFFLLQSWVPTYLHGIGTTDLKTIGVLSALPWLCTAVTATIAGVFADWLHTRCDWPTLRVRHTMQTAASLGGALPLIPLVLLPTINPLIATVLLCIAIAAQGLNYSGYHSYVQDVAPLDAGLILGITNTCGSLAGVLANLLTGSLGNFQTMFMVVIGLHFLSVVTWLGGAQGSTMDLRNPSSYSFPGGHND